MIMNLSNSKKKLISVLTGIFSIFLSGYFLLIGIQAVWLSGFDGYDQEVMEKRFYFAALTSLVLFIFSIYLFYKAKNIR